MNETMQPMKRKPWQSCTPSRNGESTWKDDISRYTLTMPHCATSQNSLTSPDGRPDGWKKCRNTTSKLSTSQGNKMRLRMLSPDDLTFRSTQFFRSEQILVLPKEYRWPSPKT